MILKKILLPAALLFLMGACNPGTEETTTPDDDSVTAIPDKDYTILAQDTGSKAVPLDPSPVESELTAQDTLFEDGSVPSNWANAGFDDPSGFKNFIATFKDWVKADNVDSIAAHINFPVKPAKTVAIFKEKYASIFDSKLKNVIASQRLDRIFRNGDGAMIGSGQIWFTVSKGGYVVTAINKN